MEYVEELRHLLTIAKNPRTIEYLQKGINAETRKMNGQDTTTAGVKTKVSSSSGSGKISNYGWDQSDKFVKIYISDLPNIGSLTTDNVKSTFTDRSMEVEIINPVSSRKHSLTISDLFKPIVPDGSNVKVKSGMVVISLKKKASVSWDCLTGREKKLKEAKDFKPDVGKSGEDPGAGLMQMMQKMYDDGDDEMKRTLRKAWHESQEKRMKGEDI